MEPCLHYRGSVRNLGDGAQAGVLLLFASGVINLEWKYDCFAIACECIGEGTGSAVSVCKGGFIRMGWPSFKITGN